MIHLFLQWVKGTPLAPHASPSSQAQGSQARDTKMDIHHITTALLCITSYATRYVKIGSLVMLLHDASDLPLDILRLFSTFKYLPGQIIFFLLTVVSWAYWRLWFLPFTVMNSIAWESKSLHIIRPCAPGECAWNLSSAIERVPFLLLLTALLTLHCIWFTQLLRKGYRELFGGKKDSKKKD
jgi:hypothetical protein